MSEPTFEGRFDACEHSWDHKYVLNVYGVVCTVCDPRWAPNPLADYEAKLADRYRETFDRIAAYFEPPQDKS